MEIPVAKKAMLDSNTLFFVAQYEGIPVGMTDGHIADGVCRILQRTSDRKLLPVVGW